MKEQQGTVGKRPWAGILFWALQSADAPFRWEQHEGLGALASEESSMTFKTPASSSPTVVNAEAICYDSSVLQPGPAVAATLFCWQLVGKATGRRQERRGEGEGVHPLCVGWAGEQWAAATRLSQPSKAHPRTSMSSMWKFLQKFHLGPL